MRAGKSLNPPHVRRASRHPERARTLQRGESDIHRARRRPARSGGGRGGDPVGGEDSAGAARGLPDARFARRRALCRQGAGAEEPGHSIYPGRAAAEALAADDLANALDADRHDPQRGGGAAARGAADQALPAALQRAFARRQKLSVHPAARGPRFSPRPAPPRRAADQGAILRAFRERRIGAQHAQFSAEIVPPPELLRQFLPEPHAALPALSNPPLLGALRRADRRGRL